MKKREGSWLWLSLWWTCALLDGDAWTTKWRRQSCTTITENSWNKCTTTVELKKRRTKMMLARTSAVSTPRSWPSFSGCSKWGIVDGPLKFASRGEKLPITNQCGDPASRNCIWDGPIRRCFRRWFAEASAGCRSFRWGAVCETWRRGCPTSSRSIWAAASTSRTLASLTHWRPTCPRWNGSISACVNKSQTRVSADWPSFVDNYKNWTWAVVVMSPTPAYCSSPGASNPSRASTCDPVGTSPISASPVWPDWARMLKAIWPSNTSDFRFKKKNAFFVFVLKKKTKGKGPDVTIADDAQQRH